MKKKFLNNIFIILIAIIGSGYFIHRSSLKDVHYYTYFDNVNGLYRGSEVQMKGVLIGKVDGITIGDTSVKIAIKLSDNYPIPQGTIAELASRGIEGEKYIQLLPGEQKIYLSSGATIEGLRDTMLFENFTAKITPVIEEGKLILHTIDSGLASFNDLFKTGLVRRFVKDIIDIDTQTKSLSRLAKSFNDNSIAITKDLRTAEKAVNDFSKKNEQVNNILDSTALKTNSLRKTDWQQQTKTLKQNISSVNKKIKDYNNARNDGSKNVYQNISGSLDTFSVSAEELQKDPPGFTIFGSNRKKK